MIAILIAVTLFLFILVGAYYAMGTETPAVTPAPVQTSPTTAAEPATQSFSVSGCEAEPPLLECPAGKAIKSGTMKYGRWDNSVCPHPTVAANTPPQSQTFDLPAEALGKQKYQYGAINVVNQADPYPNVYKQFTVNYQCK